jgi:hypothetical protein
MEIYIPENLRRIAVVSQLCKLINEYANYYEEEPEDSFNDYDFYLSYDPVKKFIGLCIPEEEFYAEDSVWDKSQNYDTIINYLSRLFYSVKGTRLVLEYMKKYLDLTFIGEIKYSPGFISFQLETINISDETVFREYLEGFLDALLFYENLDVNIARLNLTVNDKITSYIQGGVVTYLVNTPTPITEINTL